MHSLKRPFLAAAFALSGLVLVGLGLLLRAPESPARAETIEGASMVLLVPDGEAWLPLEIQMLILVQPGADPEDEAAEALAGMRERFPRALVATPGDVSAQYAEAGWTWPGGTAAWAYNPAGKPAGLQDDAGIIAAAANVWNAAGANWKFTGGAPTTRTPDLCGGGASDGSNTIGWVPSLPGSTLAITCTLFPHGVAVESDMQFDVTRKWTESEVGAQVDFFSVVLHELGHIVGLKHSEVAKAVMYGSYHPGDIRRKLDIDDRAGLYRLYGEAESTPTPTATSTSTPPPSPSPSATPSPTEPPLPQVSGPVFAPGLAAN